MWNEKERTLILASDTDMWNEKERTLILAGDNEVSNIVPNPIIRRCNDIPTHVDGR